MNISPNRAVAVLTPAVFAPLAGAISVFAADRAGLDIDAMNLTAIFIAGATIAFAKAGIWMKGWQDFEKRQELLPADALEPANDVTGFDDDVSGASDEDSDDFDAAAEHDADVTDEHDADVIGEHDDIDAPDLDDEADDDDALLAEIEAVLAASAPAASAAKG